MVRIADIAEQNPWWSQGEDFALYDLRLKRAKPIFFERKQIPLKKENIYILRGPRQVGKTTYLKDLARKLIKKGISPRDILYLSLDFFTSRRELRNAITYFFESRRDAQQVFLLLDEITSFEDWNLELKYIADQGLLQKSTILATGSSAARLKEKGERLPGRGLEGNEHYIKPLSFREFIRQSIPAEFVAASDELRHTFDRLKTVLPSSILDLNSDLQTMEREIEKLLPFKRELGYLFGLYLITGGAPGVINHYFSNRYLQKRDILESPIAEVFIRDVLGDFSRFQKQETTTRQILKALVQRYGSRYSFSTLAADIQKTHVTTIDYLEFMEDSFIGFVLYAYDFNSKDIKAKGDKKVYFFDPFIYYAIRTFLEGKEVWDIITHSLENEVLLGNLVEGIVISHLQMVREIPLLKTGKTFLWSYYDKKGKEIDALFRENGKYSAFEVKYRWQVDERDINRIAPVPKYFLLSKEDIGYKEDLMIVPVDVFLALLPVSEKNV